MGALEGEWDKIGAMDLIDLKFAWIRCEYKVVLPVLGYLGKLWSFRPFMKYIEITQIKIAVLRMETIAQERKGRLLFRKARLNEENFYYFPIYYASSEKMPSIVAKQFGKEGKFECYANKNEIMITKESFWKGKMGNGGYYL